ncbi:MAG: Gfo/Idh/MocA family oxidoreductase [Planctomycetes bacterium]|nr:Gfo/Idh/MocA family oxidoreductase [Planctomycetota bacterium]MCB9917255.1 Gfo/Idh/MocA family oxidoreductase [Planctomycetota bacterium]
MHESSRIAVVGVGHLGKHHARLLAAMPSADLVGVVDTNPDTARDVGEEWDVPYSTDVREAPLAWGAEAVSLVVPTTAHCDLAIHYLEQGLDVLVEKPLATSPEEGRRMCDAAARTGRILAVGHVERFNPAVQALHDLDVTPRYIESERLAPFTFRSTDIGVVLDLMIHDIDLVLSLIDSELEDVEVQGGALFTPAEDIASARLRFANGAVARLTANRVALRPKRQMRIFSQEGYVSIDFGKKYGLVIRKSDSWDVQKLDLGSIRTAQIQDLWKFVFEGLLQVTELKMDENNPLEDELRSFLECVRTRTAPVVDGEAALRALVVAQRVLDHLAAHPW